jgi:hypothetical protein
VCAFVANANCVESTKVTADNCSQFSASRLTLLSHSGGTQWRGESGDNIGECNVKPPLLSAVHNFVSSNHVLPVCRKGSVRAAASVRTRRMGTFSDVAEFTPTRPVREKEGVLDPRGIRLNRACICWLHTTVHAWDPIASSNADVASQNEHRAH